MKALSLMIFASLVGATTVAAQPPGDGYWAVGTEPFWGLRFSHGRIAFDVTGWPQYTYSAPVPQREATANGFRYRTRRLTVEIAHVECNDGMTDRTFADEVNVRMDGRLFQGCGGTILPPETLTGTGWRVQAIAGTPIRDDRWSIRFAAEEPLTADEDFVPNTYFLSSPCSESSGPYSRAGNVLTLGPLRSSRQVCTLARRNLELRMRQILSRPLRIAFPPDGTFVMTNERGTVTFYR